MSWTLGGIVVSVAIVALVILAVAIGRFWQRQDSGDDEVPKAVQIAAPEPVVESGWRAILRLTRSAVGDRLSALWGRSDDGRLEEMEETLLAADVGVKTTARLVNAAKSCAPDAVRAAVRAEMFAVLGAGRPGLEDDEAVRPFVILVVGVNGSGKTTTIGKLAALFRSRGRSVLVAAGDTFRAAAIEQLSVWAQRAGAEVVAHQPGADPGAVAYDAVRAAVARSRDVVLIDTAGRLQTTKPLMDELAKIRRAIAKAMPGAPHETILVVDGTVGQNAVSQASLFHSATPLTGIVVTKLDGTAKGGALFAVAAETGVPIRLVGIGERLEDLRDFDGAAFVDAIT